MTTTTEAQFDLVESYDQAPQSDWFLYCRETSRPYVVVRTGETTADVMWDYVTLPPCCDKVLLENREALRERAIAIFQRYGGSSSSVRTKTTMVFFDNLPIESARLAANELYALIDSFVGRERQQRPIQ